MSRRGYKVVYKARHHADAPSASDSTEDQLSPSRYGARALKKTTYEVGVGRNNNAYVRNASAIVVEAPARQRKRGDSESTASAPSDWEVVRPRRNRDGAYVFEMGAEDVSVASSRSSKIEIMDVPSNAEVLRSTGTRDRSLSSGTIEAMRRVHVTEEDSSSSSGDDDDDDDEEEETNSRLSRLARGRARNTSVDEAAPAQRAPSAIRKDHSPSSMARRRSRSVGFYRRDISHHDASERRHERPGTEAVVAGRYLRRRGPAAAADDDDNATILSGSTSTGTGLGQRARHGGGGGDDGDGDDDDDDDDRTYSEYSHPRRRADYPSYSARAPRPRPRYRRSRADDEESRYSASTYYR